MSTPWQALISKLARTPHDPNATRLPVPAVDAPIVKHVRNYYTAAGKGRLNYGQRTVGVGPNAVTQADLANLRARSRGANRNSGTARKACHAMVNALVGTGIRPQSVTMDRATDDRVRSLWEQWVPVADADDRGNVYWLQRQAVSAWIVSGEVFLRRRSRDMADGVRVPVEVQALESDMVPLYDFFPVGSEQNGEVTNQGIVFSSTGKRLDYLMYRAHPGDNTAAFTTFSDGQVLRIPARDISHVYDAERPGQVRGLPWGASVLEDMVALDEYMYNEAVRQESQSNFSAFIIGADQEDNQGLGTVTTDENGDYLDTITPAMVRHLAPGEDIKFAVPQVSPQLDQYSKVVYRKIAAGWGLTYAQLTGDLTSVNFSSGRMGHLDAAEQQASLQAHMVIPHVCQPMWDWFIAGAIASGALPDRAGGYPVSWHAPRPIPIDRMKELNADAKAIELMQEPVSAQIRRNGKDPRQVFREIAAEREELEALGLTTSDVAINAMGGGGDDDAVEVDDTEEIAANTDASVADTALNGAQVAQLSDIVAQVGASLMTEGAAQILIELAFPLLDADKIAAMLGAVDVIAAPTVAADA